MRGLLVVQQRTVPAALAVNPTVRLIVDGFLARYPALTREGYGIAIRQWSEWCAEHGIDLLDATRAHIESWARSLDEDRGLAKSTVGSKLNAVCGLYRFAAIDGYLPHDPAAHVRRPKIEFVSTTNGLTRPQLADMLKAAEADGPTTYALICLLALNGLRIGECLATNVEDLGYQRGYRTLFLPNRKGGKVGTLALAVRTTWALERSIDGRQSGPLLLGRDGSRLKIGSVRRTVRRLCREVGITKRTTPHSYRHAFVTAALDAGVPERDIIDSTGHSDSSMIRYYDRNRGAVERNATHAVAAFIGAAG